MLYSACASNRQGKPEERGEATQPAVRCLPRESETGSEDSTGMQMGSAAWVA
jgi:hypothetical protein